MASGSNTLEADYLVIGAGAMGMAFTDVVLAESRAAVIVVDRRDKPGGHWNDAYPFVRLHSASAYYGVNSTTLGEGTIERIGLNRGYHERASAAEICAYFDRLMRQQWLPSERVQFFPLCEYRDDGTFVSLLSGRVHRVKARKIIDATFTDSAIPANHRRSFSVGEGVRCVPPNVLPAAEAAERYVIVGAGKTAMDVCVWLLERDVSPERIQWIMPRDSWLLDRAHYEPGERFWLSRMTALATQAELIQLADSPGHLLELLNAHGLLLRIDENVRPSRYRCATVSQAELAMLRRIRDVVRLGHVRSIEAERIVLQHGDVPTTSRTLHIDCTASGIRSRKATQVFDEDKITLQPVRTCQQCFSAALIAHVELTYQDDELKNSICRPIPLPIRDIDWLTMFATNLANQFLWATTPEIRNWIANSRLDMNHGRTTPLSAEESAALQRFKAGASNAPAKLQALLA